MLLQFALSLQKARAKHTMAIPCLLSRHQGGGQDGEAKSETQQHHHVAAGQLSPAESKVAEYLYTASQGSSSHRVQDRQPTTCHHATSTQYIADSIQYQQQVHQDRVFEGRVNECILRDSQISIISCKTVKIQGFC